MSAVLSVVRHAIQKQFPLVTLNDTERGSVIACHPILKGVTWANEGLHKGAIVAMPAARGHEYGVAGGFSVIGVVD